MRLARNILLSAALSANIAVGRTSNISLGQSVPFMEALQALELQSLLPTTLTSAELEKIATEILERALFSARTVHAEYLQEIADVLDKILKGKMDFATGRLLLKQKLAALEYRPAPEDAGGLKDLSSDERINLVLETNTAMAQGYGTWMQGQDPTILDAWPAQELYRAYSRKVPRNWIQRWRDAGGEIFDGRLIALKNKSIWTDISRFGTPYPPFDFNSGMSVRDVNRKTAMRLGLIDLNQRIRPQTREFNEDLQVTPSVRDSALRKVLEEFGYTFIDGVMMP